MSELDLLCSFREGILSSWDSSRFQRTQSSIWSVNRECPLLPSYSERTLFSSSSSAFLGLFFRVAFFYFFHLLFVGVYFLILPPPSLQQPSEQIFDFSRSDLCRHHILCPVPFLRGVVNRKIMREPLKVVLYLFKLFL